VQSEEGMTQQVGWRGRERGREGGREDGYLLDSCTRRCGSWGSVQSEEGMMQQARRERGREGGEEGSMIAALGTVARGA